MDRWHGKVAVVTGSGSGIGAAIFQKLIKTDLKVVGIDKNVDQIKTGLKDVPGKCYTVKCNISIKEEVEKTFKWIKENVGIVQILINNAGLYIEGSFTEGDPEAWKALFNTNTLGPSNCSRQVLGQLKVSKLEGHIIHITSITGHYKYPGFPPIFINAYSPSKYALNCINDILRHEMNYYKQNVKISSISPGLVYATKLRSAAVTMIDPVRLLPSLQPEDVANAVLHVLGTPPHVHIQELIIRPMGECIP